MSALRPASHGTCPGLQDPMMTGDGLLARVSCVEPIALATFAALCQASRAHGNGIIEVTQRGNLQFRGLTVTSAPEFARKVSSLGLGAPADGRVMGNPLSGLEALERIDGLGSVDAPESIGGLESADAFEVVDTRELQARVRREVDFSALGPKVSVLIDGGGKLSLDEVRADIRLKASGGRFHLALGGDARSALAVGWLRLEDGIAVIQSVIALIAAGGQTARARDLVAALHIDSLPVALAPLIEPGAPPKQRRPGEPIGTHSLKGKRVARGLALPFGHSTADTLQRLARAASTLGADAIRPAPGRALLVIGLSPDDADHLAHIARAEGFVIDSGDPRRYVVACTGSPGCASASLATRELAPAIARAAGSFLDGSVTVHLSGCAKGCAHPGHASLTIRGPDQVIVNGAADDPAHGICCAERLTAGMECLRAERDRFGCQSAELLARLDFRRVVDLLHGETRLG
jgi:precorrin-3B synthase